MKLNFKCQKCQIIFDCDVGNISFPEDSERPRFEKNIICPTCGKRTMDEVFLTETGQGQLTEISFNDSDFIPGTSFDGTLCYGCDDYAPTNDLGLCNDCAEKLERDLIRKRDWDYSVSAYTLNETECENLRKKIISQYGEKLELITSGKKEKKSSKARIPRKRRNKKKK